MRTVVSRAPRGLRLALSATFLLSMAAAAAGPADDVSPAVRQALQHDLHLTAAQVSQYLKIERLAAREEKTLAAAQGRHFAGSWIERQPTGNYKLVVASTRGAQKAAADVEIREARHTLAALEA